MFNFFFEKKKSKDRFPLNSIHRWRMIHWNLDGDD
jgi:hypothetical protein